MSDTTFLISGGFFDAVDSDRLYSADQMNQPYKKLIHDGINREADGTTPGFAVTAGGGMNVLVATGNAMIGGKWAENKAVQTIAVAGNTSGSARIDSIILQCDKSRAVRAVQIVYRQGTTAAPDLVSDDDITELRLANIRVPSAASAIASENITDTRGGAECPWVRSVFDAPDARYIVEEYTESELAGAYQTVKSAIDSIRYAAQSGQPTVALQASDMIDSNLVYLYQGSETGYSTGYLYYYSDAAGAWIRGAQYGASVVDTALDEDSENPVQNKAIAVAIKTVRSFVVEVPGSAAVFSGSIAAGDFAKALATYTAGSGVYAVKDGEVYQLSAADASTMTFTQMYHGTMNIIKQLQITSADTFTVTNTALSSSAADTSYNNTASGLTATNVQAAIDENAEALSNTNGRLHDISTLTKNIVSVESGRRYVNSSGVIVESQTNWFGMVDKVPCEPNTAYVCSFHNVEYASFNPFVAEYDSNGDFIKRSESSRVTTTEDTAYIYACTYCSSGITVNDGAATQIEEGTTPTEYVPPATANDWVARAKTEGISVEGSRNILLPSLEKSVANATYTADGNGFKVVATSTSTSRLRFKLFANVTAEDVGKTFTLSALLSELSASATRIAFISGNTVRTSLGMSVAGERYSLSYTITSADVDRILWVSVYSNDAPTATGNYSIWHDIQVEESAFPTPYADPTQKTVIDYTARALTDVLMDKAEAQYNALSVKNRTLDGNVTYILTTPNPCVNIIRCRASYTGTSAPTIAFSTGLYTSPAFVVGGTEPKMQSWRIPPDLTGGGITVNITVPNGTTLNIEYLYSEESAFNPTNAASKPRFNSHLGFRQMCPENTLSAVEMAGILGYSACIVVPKATADGVLVCIHDDTINATARDENGSAPGTTMNVSDMTYAELLEWDFGKYKNAYWAGAKILTVDDFFSVCARYGMAPMFSTHPALTEAQWQTVKALLIKHGMLSKMHVKAFDLSTIEGAYAVLGQDIDGYTGEHGDSYVSIPQLQTFVSSHSIDTKKCRVVSEKSKNTITESYVSDVLAAGLECGCYTITSTESAATIKQIVSWGVTEFTDDTYCQNGMNW